jgi:hypothetical protein
MLRFTIAPFVLLLAFPLPLLAQQMPKDGVASIDANGARAEANLILLDVQGGKVQGVVALACLTYGTPDWKDEYTGKIDEVTKGRMFRLGRDNWAILDHSAPLDFGGKTVPAGTWYLAIARDQAGKWFLVFCDPAKVKAAGVWPNAADKAPRAHEIPLTAENVAGDPVEKLAIAWQRDQGHVAKGVLTLTWGTQKMSTPYEIKVDPARGGAKDSSGPKGK